MQLTLREMEQYRVPFLIWLTVSAVAGVAGPFGTLDAMGNVPRVAYWSSIAGGSIMLSIFADRIAKGFGRIGNIAVWGGFVIVLSAMLHGINSLAFSVWGGLSDWVYITATVGLVTSAVKLIVWGIGSSKGMPEPDLPRADPFMARLPIEIRGPLVRIEAQDHYLNVVTARGSTLILMRLGDAMGELEGRGLQVHRSHWIAVDGVTQHRREKGRDQLVMSDGVEIPVSRSFRPAAQGAGLF
jgi:hypothetical protein